MDQKTGGAGRLTREWITNTHVATLESYVLAGGEVGDPRDTAAHSVKELKDRGMVGIYKTADNFTFAPKR